MGYRKALRPAPQTRQIRLPATMPLKEVLKHVKAALPDPERCHMRFAGLRREGQDVVFSYMISAGKIQAST